MTQDHDFAQRKVVLKTSKGYLTQVGFTENINSKGIISIRAGKLGGKWAPVKVRIQKFKERLKADITIDETDCEFYTFHIYDKARTKPEKWTW